MEIAGGFFKWQVAMLKIFVSERRSDPFPMCLRGATPTKSLSRRHVGYSKQAKARNLNNFLGRIGVGFEVGLEVR